MQVMTPKTCHVTGTKNAYKLASDAREAGKSIAEMINSSHRRPLYDFNQFW